MKNKQRYADVTGRLYALLPDGPERDELLGFARLGVHMKRQHVGKREGVIPKLVLKCMKRAGPPYSFEQLKYQLDVEASNRNKSGERASPVEMVNRTWETVTFHLPKRGEVKITFKTLQGYLTRARKILNGANSDLP